MARKVKETPILHGEDARRFDEISEKNKSRKVSKTDYARAQASAKKFKFSN